MTDSTPSTNPSATAAPALVHVPFRGDTLDATRAPDGRVWVSIRRVCEALGMAPQVQLRKLQDKPWAVVTMMVMTGPDGKRYETSCLDLDSLPMWLATIDTRRVKGAAREKLVVYQKECARVLRAYFLGDDPDPVPPVAVSGTRVIVDEEALLARFLGADEDRGDWHPGNAARMAMGIHPNNEGFAAGTTALGIVSAELSVVREAMRSIRSGKNAYADLRDVDTVMAAMERRTLGLARLEAYGLLEKADRALQSRKPN